MSRPDGFAVRVAPQGWFRLGGRAAIGLFLALGSNACTGERGNAAVPRIRADVVRETADRTWLADEDVIDVLPVSDSSFVVSVQNGSELVLVNWRGERRAVIAGRGQGPGEVRGVAWLVGRGNAEFASVDVLLRRISWWNTSGQHLRDASLELPMITGVWEGKGRVVVRTIPGSSMMHFSDVDDEGAAAFRFAVSSHALASGASCGYCAAAVGIDGTVALAAADTSYTIYFLGARGDSLTAVHVPGVPVIALAQQEVDSVAEVWRMVEGRILANGGRAASLSRVRAAAAVSKFKKRFVPRSFLLDTEGILWAQRNVSRGDSAEVDLIDRRRGRIGVLRLAPGSEIRRVQGRRLIVVRSMEGGSSRVVELLVDLR